jgi:hypothetical protein
MVWDYVCSWGCCVSGEEIESGHIDLLAHIDDFEIETY